VDVLGGEPWGPQHVAIRSDPLRHGRNGPTPGPHPGLSKVNIRPTTAILHRATLCDPLTSLRKRTSLLLGLLDVKVDQ